MLEHDQRQEDPLLLGQGSHIGLYPTQGLMDRCLRWCAQEVAQLPWHVCSDNPYWLLLDGHHLGESFGYNKKLGCWFMTWEPQIPEPCYYAPANHAGQLLPSLVTPLDEYGLQI